MLHIIWAISNGFKSMLHKKINTWSVLFSVETISSQLFNDLNPKNLLDWDILSSRWSVTYPLFEIDRTRYKSTLNIRKLWLFCFYNERQKHENMIRWPRSSGPEQQFTWKLVACFMIIGIRSILEHLNKVAIGSSITRNCPTICHRLEYLDSLFVNFKPFETEFKSLIKMNAFQLRP